MQEKQFDSYCESHCRLLLLISSPNAEYLTDCLNFFIILSFLRSSHTLNVLLHCLGCLGTFFDSGCLISLFLCLHLFLLLVFAWLLLFFQITLGWADLLSVLWHCWVAGRASSHKKSGGVLAWLFVWSEVQTSVLLRLQCSDAVGWAAGRASGL